MRKGAVPAHGQGRPLAPSGYLPFADRSVRKKMFEKKNRKKQKKMEKSVDNGTGVWYYT